MKPEKKVKKTKVTKNKGNSTLIIGVIAVIILIGIAYTVLSGGSQAGDGKKTTGMTLKELRAQVDAEYAKKGYSGTNTPPVRDDYTPILSPKKADNLPDYVYTNAMTLKAYQYATEHPEVLEQMACYCGCGQHGSETSDGKAHRFLRDCFINDRGEYDSHASTCDVCIGIAIKAQSNFPSGLSGPGAATGQSPQSAPSVDLSALSLPDNFNSLADGLNLTPAGVNRAYFVNVKMLSGTEMEATFLEGSVQPDIFYGKKVIGMYSADFSATSWLELHDLGYDSTKDTALRARTEQGMKNIIYTRPLIYGHSQNVDSVLKLISDPKSIATSYKTYKPLLDAVDYQNTAYAMVIAQANKFSDINYVSMAPKDGKIELVKAYNITDNKSIPAALNKYAPQIKGKVLVIQVTGDLKTVEGEANNIDAAART